MPFHELPERILAPLADERHEDKIIGFGLDGIRHEKAFLNQLRPKEKPFGAGRPAGEKPPNRTGPGGVYSKFGKEAFMKKWLIGCMAAGLVAGTAWAGVPAELEAQAKEAMGKGAAWLAAQQQADGHWGVPDTPALTALAMQALHRVRQGCVRRRTALANQMRGLLLEHGVALAQGDAALTRGVDQVLKDATRPIPALLRELVADVHAEWQRLGERIDGLVGTTGESVATGTLPRLNVLLQELTTTSRQLSDLLDEIDETPQLLLLGRRRPPPGPGEAGFGAPAGSH